MDATKKGDPTVLVGRIARHRRESFSSFYCGDKYYNWDVPHIATKYLDFGKGAKLIIAGESKRIRQQNFQPENMDTIEEDF